MIKKIKNQNISHNAFTLIEMVIVLVIMGILLMSTVFLSGDQIQKVKNKTVKEAILAEMQSRYSRNLGSSSFAGNMYDTMEVIFSGGENKITFKYITGDVENYLENIFVDNFEIMYITKSYGSATPDSDFVDQITLKYTPYNISCNIGDDDEDNKNVVLAIRVNNKKDYCFVINEKNCRLIEMSEDKCKNLGDLSARYSYLP